MPFLVIAAIDAARRALFILFYYAAIIYFIDAFDIILSLMPLLPPIIIVLLRRFDGCRIATPPLFIFIIFLYWFTLLSSLLFDAITLLTLRHYFSLIDVYLRDATPPHTPLLHLIISRCCYWGFHLSMLFWLSPLLSFSPSAIDTLLRHYIIIVFFAIRCWCHYAFDAISFFFIFLLIFSPRYHFFRHFLLLASFAILLRCHMLMRFHTFHFIMLPCLPLFSFRWLSRLATIVIFDIFCHYYAVDYFIFFFFSMIFRLMLSSLRADALLPWRHFFLHFDISSSFSLRWYYFRHCHWCRAFRHWCAAAFDAIIFAFIFAMMLSLFIMLISVITLFAAISLRCLRHYAALIWHYFAIYFPSLIIISFIFCRWCHFRLFHFHYAFIIFFALITPLSSSAFILYYFFSFRYYWYATPYLFSPLFRFLRYAITLITLLKHYWCFRRDIISLPLILRWLAFFAILFSFSLFRHFSSFYAADVFRWYFRHIDVFCHYHWYFALTPCHAAFFADADYYVCTFRHIVLMTLLLMLISCWLLSPCLHCCRAISMPFRWLIIAIFCFHYYVIFCFTLLYYNIFIIDFVFDVTPLFIISSTWCFAAPCRLLFDAIISPCRYFISSSFSSMPTLFRRLFSPLHYFITPLFSFIFSVSLRFLSLFSLLIIILRRWYLRWCFLYVIFRFIFISFLLVRCFHCCHYWHYVIFITLIITDFHFIDYHYFAHYFTCFHFDYFHYRLRFFFAITPHFHYFDAILCRFRFHYFTLLRCFRCFIIFIIFIISAAFFFSPLLRFDYHYWCWLCWCWCRRRRCHYALPFRFLHFAFWLFRRRCWFDDATPLFYCRRHVISPLFRCRFTISFSPMPLSFRHFSICHWFIFAISCLIKIISLLSPADAWFLPWYSSIIFTRRRRAIRHMIRRAIAIAAASHYYAIVLLCRFRYSAIRCRYLFDLLAAMLCHYACAPL